MLALNLRRTGRGRDLTRVHTATASPAATSWTISSAPLGDADTNRRVIVAFMGFVATGFTLSTVTIGGVSATIHTSRIGTNVAAFVASAVVPTGTTGNIVITGTTANITTGHIAVFRAVGFGAGNSANNLASSASTISTTLTASNNGYTVRAGVGSFASIGTYTATGNFTTNEYTAGTGTATVYGAWLDYPTSGASETYTLNWSSTASQLVLATTNFT